MLITYDNFDPTSYEADAHLRFRVLCLRRGEGRIPRGYALERSGSWGATCPARARSHVTTRPKTNPPTCAKNATPPPFAEALNSPKLASMSWYKNHSPRKTQAGIRTRKIGKIRVRIREPG